MWKLLLFLMNAGGSEVPEQSTTRNQINFEIVTSQRGKAVLLRAGHRYNQRKINKNSSCLWQCAKREICKATLVTTVDSILKEEKHNCEPDFASNQIEMQIETCVDKVKNDCTIPVPSLFRDTIAELHDSGIDLVKKLPSFENIKNKLYRQRNKSLAVRKVCFNSIEEIIVPERFNSFVLADYCYDSNRILVFAGDHSKTILSNPNLMILCDGTFKFCLHPFQQLYSLHVDLGSDETHNNIIPIIYALLPNKMKNTYETLFSLIKSQIPQFNPTSFLLDFEQAAMSAIETIFPDTTIRGCFFHFSRSLWRKAEELRITKSKLARKHIKRCVVLAHLPIESIDSAWLYIMSQCPNNENIIPFNDYFVQTWLNDTSFFVNKWCLYNMDIRTTNMVESWHSTINKKIHTKPKSIVQFLTVLQKEDNYYQTLYYKGCKITKKIKVTREINEHIDTTIKEFQRGEINIDLCIERLIV